MTDPTLELAKQGIIGLVAGIFLWLYLREIGRHDQTRKEKDALMEARRVDAKEVVDKVEEPLRSVATSFKLLADKFSSVQRGKR